LQRFVVEIEGKINILGFIEAVKIDGMPTGSFVAAPVIGMVFEGHCIGEPVYGYAG
jgi:hypothetical protein